MAKVNRVEVEIVANDEASPKIDRLTKRIDGLESDEARIVVTAETTRLEQQLASAQAKLDGLTGDEATVQARLVGTIEKDLEDARRLFEQLDGETGKVTLTADVSQAESALSGLDDVVDGIDAKLGGLGSKLATPTGAVATLAGGLLLAANRAADLAIEADNVSKLTGDSVEFASQLVALWKSTGAGVSDLQDVLLQMNDTLADDAELTERLGINLGDGATAGERFREVFRILEGIADATDRARIASKLFGEEGVRQYNALAASVEDLDAALAEQSVFTADDVEQARKTKQAIRELTVEFEKMAAAVGGVVVPVIGALVTELNTAFEAAFDLGRGIRGFFDAEARDNFKRIEAWERANEAAQTFDRTMLDGLDTAKQVNDVVLELTGSQTAANIVVAEWARSQQQLNTDLSLTAGPAGAAGAAFKQLAEDADEVFDSVSSVRGEFESLFGLLDQREAIRNAQRALEDVRVAAENAFKKAGTPEAAEAMRDYEEAVDRALRRLAEAGQDPITINTVLETFSQGQINEAIAIAQAKLGQAPPLRFPVALDFRETNLRFDEFGNVQSRYTPPPPSLNFQTAAPNITVINPPGTPQSIYEGYAIFESRNGAR